MYIYICIYIYIYILEANAGFARASTPGPWWGPPLGSSGVLRKPWALVAPALVGPSSGP